jgi:hypothetical protein
VAAFGHPEWEQGLTGVITSRNSIAHDIKSYRAVIFKKAPVPPGRTLVPGYLTRRLVV